MCDLTVNGLPIETWGAVCDLNFSIGETPITNDYFQGVNRSSFALMRSTFGLRTINLTFTFSGSDLYEAKVRRSKFNREVYGKSELYIPYDGFSYTVMLDNCGAEELVGIGDSEAKIRSEYTFKGFRHGPLQQHILGYNQNNPIWVDSTVPWTDCRIYSDVRTQSSVTLRWVTFTDIPSSGAAQILLADGIDKKLTINGYNWANHASLSEWPRLEPGLNYVNNITSTTGATLEFYPIYL